MPPDFVVVALGAIVLLGAVTAISMRHLVHSVLCLMVCFLGLAGLFLHLGALFAGLVQVLVYVGAVGVLIVFAILLTAGGGQEDASFLSVKWPVGAAVTALLAVVLVGGILQSPEITSRPPQPGEVTVRMIGTRMLTDYVIALEAMALLLTATAIGAIVLAMPEAREQEERE